MEVSTQVSVSRPVSRPLFLVSVSVSDPTPHGLGLGLGLGTRGLEELAGLGPRPAAIFHRSFSPVFSFFC